MRWDTAAFPKASFQEQSWLYPYVFRSLNSAGRGRAVCFRDTRALAGCRDTRFASITLRLATAQAPAPVFWHRK